MRPANFIMVAFGVSLGFWLSLAFQIKSIKDLLLLIISSICATGFGNVINDIIDIETDKISHPKRPLVLGNISTRNAIIFSAVLGLFAIFSSLLVSFQHGIGALIPLLLLLFYSLYFKSTPLAGNIIVSLLVAYTLIYGGICGQELKRLIIPSFLAFLLNFSREIIKDIQDQEGDKKAGYITSASLSPIILRIIIAFCSLMYAFGVILPYISGGFGIIYAIVCLFFIVPLHIYWNLLFYKTEYKIFLAKISSLIKLEMLCGLFALAIDESYKLFIK
jgi:geranylgeranylglycerol-phosphate geranylgeranyltransferase